jgi:protein tyrosine phosphatase (PTP) superfamily phosphohydrolase (DUF442 family)
MSYIYNFHQISDLLACSGQPQEDQLKTIAADGYQAVINLGLSDSKYALADEAASVKDLGLAYHHLPIAFDNPQIDELAEFISIMKEHTSDKTLVHCAANYRASVFAGLYLLAVDELDEEKMQEMIENVWQPDAVWQQFIEEGMEYIKNRD